MIHPRCDHGIGRIEDQIFIIGGFVEGDGITKSVERFSNLKKEWKEISPMIQKRRNPGVGVVDDKIFVFGGWDDGEQYLKTIEVYSEKTKRWEMMKVTMKTRRSYMGVAVIGDIIFIHWWLE